LIRPDSLYDRPIGERHRIIFYLGHLEAFDWNLIARYALDVPPFHADFDKLFAFGIDPPPGQLPTTLRPRGPASPSSSATISVRARLSTSFCRRSPSNCSMSPLSTA